MANVQIEARDLRRLIDDAWKRWESGNPGRKTRNRTNWEGLQRAVLDNYGADVFSSRYLHVKNGETYNKGGIIRMRDEGARALFTYARPDVDRDGPEFDRLFRSNRSIEPDGVARIRNIERRVSESDPARPEFPPGNPAFPATPTIRIRYEGWSGLMVKDESYNPWSGTHKDRMAWELVRYYTNVIEGARRKGRPAPSLSLISAGAAATAVQRALPTDYPDLRVLVDRNTDSGILASLDRDGCVVFTTDLSSGELTPRDVLERTENPDGIDLTFPTRSELGDFQRDYYDWMCFEILNQNPDYCIVPVGTGDLFFSLLTKLAAHLRNGERKDQRWFGVAEKLRNCVFWGAACNPSRSSTRLDKLYHPFLYSYLQSVEPFHGVCHASSRVIEVDEDLIEPAMDLARANGILAEPSSIAALSLFLKMSPDIREDKRILIVSTGRLILHDEQNLSRTQLLQKMVTT